MKFDADERKRRAFAAWLGDEKSRWQRALRRLGYADASFENVVRAYRGLGLKIEDFEFVDTDLLLAALENKANLQEHICTNRDARTTCEASLSLTELTEQALSKVVSESYVGISGHDEIVLIRTLNDGPTYTQLMFGGATVLRKLARLQGGRPRKIWMEPEEARRIRGDLSYTVFGRLLNPDDPIDPDSIRDAEIHGVKSSKLAQRLSDFAAKKIVGKKPK